MDDINRKLKSIDWTRLQRQARKVQASTASALKDLVMTDLENKVRAATADTSWGASSSDLMEIAQGTYHREDYALIMSIVWQRLGSSRWRCVYKALEVLRYLIMHGSSRCLEEACAAQHHIQTLEHYRCIDPDTRRDEGENVRARAAIVVAMIANPAILEEERQKDRALRAKLSAGASVHGPNSHAGGFSSDDYQYNRNAHVVSSGGHPGHSDSSFDYRSGYDGAGVTARYDAEARGSLSARSNSGGYDDVPRSKFAMIGRGPAVDGHGVAPASERPEQKQSASLMNQSVDDLLGGDSGPVAGTAITHPSTASSAFEEDDDFNPRAYASAGAADSGTASTAKVGAASDVLSSLSLGDDTATNAGPKSSSKPSDVPMSVLVQNLARQSGNQRAKETLGGASLGATNPATGGISSNGVDKPDADGSFFSYGVDDTAAVGSAGAHTEAADRRGNAVKGVTREGSPKLAVSSTKVESAVVHKDVDPFADLVLAVKKS